jgi:hypothetical protein
MEGRVSKSALQKGWLPFMRSAASTALFVARIFDTRKFNWRGTFEHSTAMRWKSGSSKIEKEPRLVRPFSAGSMPWTPSTMTTVERQEPRIILFGHSWGASAVVYLARELEQDGIPITLTIQIDSVRKHGQDDSIYSSQRAHI